MLKTTFIIIVLLHGLIHVLGFLKAFDYADITAITREISKPSGIFWLTATILFLLTSLFFILRNDVWVYFGLASVIISQSLIFMYWQDTRYGTIANILILLVIIVGVFHLKFKNKYKAEVQTGIEQTGHLSESMLTNEDIKHLPELVQKYIKYTGSIGKPKVHNFRIEFAGKIRSYEKKEWMALTSEQYNFLPVPTRLFFLDATKMQMPVSGFHCFKNGKAFMDIRLLSMFKVQYMEGKEMDESETVTFFNDMCCMAPATLIDDRIQWLETEGNKVKASFTDFGHEVTAWLHFNEKGELINFISEDRYAVKEDGGLSKLKWSTPLRDYKEINGYKLATYAETIYTYPDGDFTYATFTLKNIGVNLKK